MDHWKAIAERAEEIKQILPPGTMELVRRCNHDLYNGPLYLVRETEWPFATYEASCFDEGAFPFGFVTAATELSDILEEYVETEYLEWDIGCWSNVEPVGEWYCCATDEYSTEEPGWTDEEWEYNDPPDYIEVHPKWFKKEIVGSALLDYI